MNIQEHLDNDKALEYLKKDDATYEGFKAILTENYVKYFKAQNVDITKYKAPAGTRSQWRMLYIQSKTLSQIIKDPTVKGARFRYIFKKRAGLVFDNFRSNLFKPKSENQR